MQTLLQPVHIRLYLACYLGIYADLDNIHLYLFNNLIKGLSVITNFALWI